MSEEKIISELIRMKNKSARHRELKSYLLANGFSDEKAEEQIAKANEINSQNNSDSLPMINKIKFGISAGFVLLILILYFFVFPYKTYVHVRIFSIFGTIFFGMAFYYALQYYRSWEKEKIEQKSKFPNQFNVDVPIGLLLIPIVLIYFIFSWFLESGQETILKETQVETTGTIVAGSSLSSRSFDMTELNIEYITKDGKKIKASQEISKTEFNKYYLGQRVQLLYSTADTQNIVLLATEENIKKYKDSEERNLALNDFFSLLETPNNTILEKLNKIKYGWVYDQNVWVNDSYESLIMKDEKSVSFVTSQNLVYTFPNKIKELGYNEISKKPIKNPLIDMNRTFENDKFIISFKKEYISGKHLVNMTIREK